MSLSEWIEMMVLGRDMRWNVEVLIEGASITRRKGHPLPQYGAEWMVADDTGTYITNWCWTPRTRAEARLILERVDAEQTEVGDE